MDNYLQLLQNRKSELEHYREEVLKRLDKLNYKGEPKCRIRISSKKNQVYLIQSKAQMKEKYLKSSQKAYAVQIATFDYLMVVLKKINTELEQIDSFLKKGERVSPEEYYETLNASRQNLITPIRPTDEQFVNAWISKPYVGGVFEEGEAEFYTDRNERVRSKSEILIANALAKNNVPYKYECPIVLKGLGKIHPDFTALNVKRRKVFYWEHLGKLDDADYARKNVFRINAYEKNGIYHGENLITTWETSTLPLDVKLVDQLIKHYLLE